MVTAGSTITEIRRRTGGQLVACLLFAAVQMEQESRHERQAAGHSRGQRSSATGRNPGSFKAGKGAVRWVVAVHLLG